MDTNEGNEQAPSQSQPTTTAERTGVDGAAAPPAPAAQPPQGRFARWGRKQAAAAGLAVGSGIGALATSLITGYLGDALDSDRLIDAALPGAPIRATVEHPVGNSVVSQERIEISPDAAMGEEGVRDHFRAHQAADAGGMALRLGLEGRRNQVVRVTDIRPVVSERGEPFAGSLFTLLEAGGGDETESMTFDMDALQPVGMWTDVTTGELVGPYFNKRTITLAEHEVVTVVLYFSAYESSSRFELDIDVVYGSTRETVRVSDNGKPFGFSACRGDVKDYGSAYALDGDEFIAVSDPHAWVPPDEYAYFARDPCGQEKNFTPDSEAEGPAEPRS